MKECWLKPFEVKHFRMKHLETEKRPKKEKKLFQASLQITEKVTEKLKRLWWCVLLQSCLTKNSTMDGCF